jgi:fatty acid desaturase
MSEPDKSVDLAPHEWRSSDSREKPKEPIFQPGGLAILFGVIGAVAFATTAIHTGWLPPWMAGAIGGAIGAAVSALPRRQPPQE